MFPNILTVLTICSFVLVLNAFRHICNSHTVRYDNVFKQDFVFIFSIVHSRIRMTCCG